MKRKTKILFVRPTLGMGGADRVTLNILKSFDRDTYECDLFLNLKEGEFINDLPDDVSIFTANSHNVLLMLFPLLKQISRGNYDYVYSTSGGTNVAVVLAGMLSRSGFKSVISFRSSVIQKDKGKLKALAWKKLRQSTLRKTDFCTVVARELERDVASTYKISEKRIFTVNNPLVNKDLHDRKSEPLGEEFESDRPSILAVGRLIKVKNYDLLINSFADIADNTKAILYILGEGSERPHLEDLIQQSGLTSRVKLLGFDKNPFKWMSKVDLFVLSSNNEGMPGVLVQALACGACCISTDCKTGPKELIEDGHNGFLVEVGDRKALSSKMQQLLHDRSLASQFRSRAPLSIKRFNEKEGIESYFSFLEKDQ